MARNFVSSGPIHAALTVAVVPFENLTNHPNAGIIVAELLATELYHQGTFRLMEGTELRRQLEGRDIDLAKVGVTMAAGQLAAGLGVDAVVVGSVSEYGYQHGLHEEPTVGINLRLVSACDGEVLWAASHSETGGGVLRRDSVNEAAQRAVLEMVVELNRRLDARAKGGS